MTTKYSNFLDSVDSFFSSSSGNLFGQNLHASNYDLLKKNITKFLFCTWSNFELDDLIFEKIITSPYKTVSFKQVVEDYDIKRLIKELQEVSRFAEVKTLSNLEFDYINKFVQPMYDFLTSFSQNMNVQITKIRYISEELINIFFRLTQYSDGSYVPLVDLIKDNFVHLFYQTANNDNSVFNSQLMQYKYAIEGILYTLQKMNAPFPAPYYYKLAVFERTDTLNQALRDLESSMNYFSQVKL